jgi:hypothetical protein
MDPLDRTGQRMGALLFLRSYALAGHGMVYLAACCGPAMPRLWLDQRICRHERWWLGFRIQPQLGGSNPLCCDGLVCPRMGPPLRVSQARSMDAPQVGPGWFLVNHRPLVRRASDPNCLWMVEPVTPPKIHPWVCARLFPISLRRCT